MHIGEAMKKEMVAYLRLEILYKLHKYWSTFIFRRPLFEDVKSMNHAFCEFFRRESKMPDGENEWSVITISNVFQT